MRNSEFTNQLYEQGIELDKIGKTIFWTNASLCIFSTFLAWMQGCPLLNVVLVVLPLLYLIICIIRNVECWYPAEKSRRIQAVHNGFLESPHGDVYFSNPALPSLTRYGLNLYESFFYTKRIVKKMKVGALIELSAALVVLIIALQLSGVGNMAVTFANTLFSGYVVLDIVRFLWFSSQLDSLEDGFKKCFESVDVKDAHWQETVMECCVEYEALKAFSKVQLSEAIFESSKEEIKQDWYRVISGLKLDQK